MPQKTAQKPSLSGKKRKAAPEEKDSGSGQRPERTGAAEKFYSKSEASKYEQNSRMATTQRHLAERALHLIDLKEGVPALILDVGCGTGYSGRPLEKAGHTWIGTDISDNMLSAARAPTRRRDVVCADVGVGLGFRKGSFDGVVSVSAVQWLCVATRPEHDPYKRCRKFFIGLHAVLAPNARAALQIYPEEPTHMEMLRDAALKAGFEGAPSTLIDVTPPWQCPATALAPAQGAPGGSGRLEAPRGRGLATGRPASYRLGCSSYRRLQSRPARRLRPCRRARHRLPHVGVFEEDVPRARGQAAAAQAAARRKGQGCQGRQGRQGQGRQG